MVADGLQREFQAYYRNAEGGAFMPLGTEPVCGSRKVIDGMTFGQHVVHKIATDLLSRPDNKQGVLIWHSTGTGKTCAAAAVMEAFLGTGRTVFYISTYQGLRSNGPAAFMECAASLFPPLAEALTGEAHRFQFTTIRKFANAVSDRDYVAGSDVLKRKEALKGAVIILDEVHKVFDPSASLEAMYYKEVHEYLLKRREELGCVLVLMTATPGRTVEELTDLLNMVRDPATPPLLYDDAHPEAYTEAARGLVSHIDMSGDQRLFPKVVEHREEVPMSAAQQEAYRERARKDDLRAARRYANALFKKEPSDAWEGFSPKCVAFYRNLAAAQDCKHYMYSCFHDRRGSGGHGVHTVAMLLLERGYTQLLPDMCKEGRELPKQKRFMLLTNQDIANGSASEAVEQENIEALMRVFNGPANADGSVVHALLASQGYNESIDLMAVQHVHILEPQLEKVDEIQAIGRAVRRCSHGQLPQDRRAVHVHRYLSTQAPRGEELKRLQRVQADLELSEFLLEFRPELSSAEALDVGRLRQARNKLLASQDTRTVDHLVEEHASARYAAMRRAMDAVRAAAVDCLVTSRYHGQRLGIACAEGR